ncbi:MAG: hypothetical protein HQ511_05325 [Rhodospirillales bacterium]|nr:hypothetical protein [Rhodospirillales bacterium]
MTKTKARKRAKAKAAARVAGTPPPPREQGGAPEVKTHPGKFDPQTKGLKGASANVKGGGGAQRRGAARSR